MMNEQDMGGPDLMIVFDYLLTLNGLMIKDVINNWPLIEEQRNKLCVSHQTDDKPSRSKRTKVEDPTAPTTVDESYRATVSEIHSASRPKSVWHFQTNIWFRLEDSIGLCIASLWSKWSQTRSGWTWLEIDLLLLTACIVQTEFAFCLTVARWTCSYVSHKTIC